jgi:hypothetical protein
MHLDIWIPFIIKDQKKKKNSQEFGLSRNGANTKSRVKINLSFGFG